VNLLEFLVSSRHLPAHVGTVWWAQHNNSNNNSSLISFYASARYNVAGVILFFVLFFCASVCTSQNINTISCRVLDTFSPNLHQRCTVGQRWTRHNLGSIGQRSRSRWNKVCWKQLSGLVNTLSWKVLVRFLPNFYTNDVLWERDECVKFWG